MAIGLGATVVGLGAILFGGSGGSAVQPPLPPHASQDDAPPPPAMTFEFISPEGRFQVAEFDDRSLSSSDKLKDPRFHPAWNHFARCMADGGVEVRSNPGAQFTQLDMDVLVARVNADNPDANENRALPASGADRAGGSARIFLACPNEWLHKTAREM